MSRAGARELAAVVIPMYRLPLTPSEQLSLQHARRHLRQHPHVVIAPRSLHIADHWVSGMTVERFDDHFFVSLDAYSRLLVTADFYRRFSHVEYILLYQLDCLVFSDQLHHWCAQQWDYIGAPWFHDFKADVSRGLWRTGNGGFSLRRVPTCIRVLESSRIAGRLRTFWDRLTCDYRTLSWMRGFDSHEDVFWAFYAPLFVPEFRIAPPQVALRFSFEVAPRDCYELAGRQLPFGCHAWQRYDETFWRSMMQPESDATGAVLVHEQHP